MTRIVLIVEGHGEVLAAPVLVRRIVAAIQPDANLEILRPIRVRRQSLLKQGGLERAVELAARQAGDDGRILILVDADRDCPAEIGVEILERATATRGDRRIRAVLAKTEFESWLVAAASSIAGRRGLAENASEPSDAESIRDAKKWLGDRMPHGRSYRPTIDQAAFTATFDLELARRNAPSFSKMWRDVVALL